VSWLAGLPLPPSLLEMQAGGWRFAGSARSAASDRTCLPSWPGSAGATLCRCEKGRNCVALTILVRLLKALDCDSETFGRRLGPWGCADQAALPWTPECRVALARLRQARKEAGLTQAAAGQRFGAGRNLVGKVECGGRRLDAGELARLAAIYGKPWDWFLA
jgi:hypothetical protein